MTLYIYRVGWTYPARNPITRSKSIKIPSCTRIPLGPVRPVDPTGQTGRLLPDRLHRLTGQTARAYRSDRSVLSNANFSRQQYIACTAVHFVICSTSLSVFSSRSVYGFAVFSRCSYMYCKETFHASSISQLHAHVCTLVPE